ncbi:hypothetical protein E4U13_008210 [Claviceps humidiphila]|uniref:Uncharacterized protein n=1 Tax=Claviceps humidiphila TaxID=1294629 RepID=A0A9P7PVB2_9HYPO|nr:hypothetical protein E4U13_008210 [Claviceps humidiphila]
MVGTRATPALDAGPSGQHDTATNDIRARMEALRAQADLLEEENRLARAIQGARRLEVEQQVDPADLRGRTSKRVFPRGFRDLLRPPVRDSSGGLRQKDVKHDSVFDCI